MSDAVQYRYEISQQMDLPWAYLYFLSVTLKFLYLTGLNMSDTVQDRYAISQQMGSPWAYLYFYFIYVRASKAQEFRLEQRDNFEGRRSEIIHFRKTGKPLTGSGLTTVGHLNAKYISAASALLLCRLEQHRMDQKLTIGK